MKKLACAAVLLAAAVMLWAFDCGRRSSRSATSSESRQQVGQAGRVQEEHLAVTTRPTVPALATEDVEQRAPAFDGLVDTREEAAQFLATVFDDESLGPADQLPAFVEALRDSGSSTEGWTGRARDLIKARFADRIDVRVSDAQCYRAGCYVTLEASDRRDLERALRLSPEPNPQDLLVGDWEGGSLVTPIQGTSSDRFSAAVILPRP